MSWIPWLLVISLVSVLAWMVSDVDPNFASRHMYLRTGFLVAGLGLCFAFDDPAVPLTNPAPQPLWRRRLLRVLIGFAPWLVVMGVLLGFATSDGFQPVLVLPTAPMLPLLPVGRLVLEAATIGAWGLAVASLVAAYTEEEPGRIASVALLALYVASWLLPDNTLRPWTGPGSVSWITTAPFWWGALVLGLSVAMATSWDPRRRLFGR